MPNNSLNDYAVLITGGTTGLGLSHARVLGMRGAKVAITDFNQGNLDQAKAALKGDGIAALCLKADNRVVAVQAAVPGMKKRQFGRIINTGSTFVMTGSPAMSHYAGAKGALTALARSWA